MSPHFQLEGYTMSTRNRHVSYTTHPDMAKKIGGVAVYCRTNIKAEPWGYGRNVTDSLIIHCYQSKGPSESTDCNNLHVTKLQTGQIITRMEDLLDSLDMMNLQPVIICGDFNEDLISTGKKKFHKRVITYKRILTNYVSQKTTTEKTNKKTQNTLIDHIYISNPNSCLQSGVLHTYYS